MHANSQRGVVLIPAFNEEEALESLLAEVREVVGDLAVVVINDCSLDHTSRIARDLGARVLDLPCNLGIGGAMQAGFRYARDHDFDFVVRCDGDGQHPPAEIPKLLAALASEDVDLVTGSRFKGEASYTSTRVRKLGIAGLARMLSIICRQEVTDPTSGFHAYSRELISYFAHRYPVDYPEPEAIALLCRQGYRFMEVPVVFRARSSGVSSIGQWATLYYALKVGLALLVDRARLIDPRFARGAVAETT